MKYNNKNCIFKVKINETYIIKRLKLTIIKLQHIRFILDESEEIKIHLL